MLRVRTLGDDAAGLHQAMDGFQYWGNIRGLLQVLAFVANLWSLVELSGRASTPPKPRPMLGGLLGHRPRQCVRNSASRMITGLQRSPKRSAHGKPRGIRYPRSWSGAVAATDGGGSLQQ
jgi:hypothetical protein